MHSALSELCYRLHMPEPVICDILSFAEAADLETLRSSMVLMFRPECWEKGLDLLKQQLGEDPKGIRMLTCQLICALETRNRYQAAGISDSVFLATMDCFPRFVKEHRESFGFYGFDREWWTVRQLSGVLFRIGLLEYELIEGFVSLHIPSGARLEPSAVAASVEAAREFIARYFPDWQEAPFICHSWLLSPTLRELLPVDSYILHFQSLFDITPTGLSDRDFLVWVFRNKDIPLSQLPENTSLQRKLKAHLLEGKSFQDARGILL